MRTTSLPIAILCLGLLAPAAALPGTGNAEDLTVLRNTVINILDALVKQGLITKQTAEKLVAEAQAKADAEAAAQPGPAAEPGDVRVTYVPQSVQDQITASVKKDIQASMVQEVKQQAQAEGWGVPAALPAWIRNSTWSGEIRVRSDTSLYASDNEPDTYPDFQAINVAGGFAKAGNGAFYNTTENQTLYQVRMNFGGAFDISPISMAAIRFGTGNQLNPVTRNQALGSYERTFPVLLEEAYIRLGGNLDGDQQSLYFWAGRTPNPFQSTELIWDADVRFNGFTAQYAWTPAAGARPRGVFGVLGAYTLQDVQLSSHDKWLYAGEVGYEFDPAEGVRVSLATTYYDYENVTGKRNAPDSTLDNWTAPQWLQKGNTLFDILNDSDPNTELFALAPEYKLVNINGTLSWLLRPDLELGFTADYVKNVGYDEQQIYERTGALVPERASGYRTEVRLGHRQVLTPWSWRASLAYMYLERDAVLDAFTDSDFHRGGTDAKGYTLSGDLGITTGTWVRLRYMSADAIDGPTLGVDVIQLDLNARF